jgi:hypothetical protein
MSGKTFSQPRLFYRRLPALRRAAFFINALRARSSAAVDRDHDARGNGGSGGTAVFIVISRHRRQS